MKYAEKVKPKASTIKQTQPLDGTQVKNDAGGFVYDIGAWGQLDRFLILGAEGGTYYCQEQKHVKRNYEALKQCLAEDGLKVVNKIVDVSTRGLAPKQDHAIFALAVAASEGDLETRTAALAHVNDVCRTATTFFYFLEELKSMRKLTGRAIKRTIKNWYDARDVNQVAYQAVKYRNRNGWTHADALRVGHPSPNGDVSRNTLYKWIVDDEWSKDVAQPDIIKGYLAAASADNVKQVVKLIDDFKLPREAVPTQFLNAAEVWEALLPHMPMNALIRNLGNMTKSGLLTPGSSNTKFILEKLSNDEYLRKSRVHPLQVLVAMKTYASGASVRGSGEWKPVSSITASLDDAFYKTFGNIEPTGKRMLIGVDVSGSMSWASGLPGGLVPCEIAAAMSMIWAATEETVEVMGFADKFVDLGYHRKMSLNEAMSKAQRHNFGSTDCALPMLYASKNKHEYDAFVVITDNETYYGDKHPKVALDEYRKNFVKDAKQIVMATSSSNFSIADPKDPFALDIAGFSADVPQVIAAFLGGVKPSQVTEDEA